MRARLLITAILGAASLAACASMAPSGHAAPMHMVAPSGEGASVGEIVLSNSPGGVVLHARLHGLPPGDHGMHLHANGSCAAMANASGEMVPAGGAGSHFDPAQTGHHEGPSGVGHLGDLPLLHVEANGAANVTLVAPRFHDVGELAGHAIVLHANGDNYSDMPAALGGGGGRIACGVVG